MTEPFKFSVDRQEGLAVETKTAEPVATKARPTHATKHYASDYDEEIASMMRTDPVRSRLFYLALLLKVPKFWGGGEGIINERGEWVNRDGAFDLQEAIDRRVQELGLDLALIEEYSHSPQTVAEGRAFDRLSFEDRMRRFRGVAA